MTILYVEVNKVKKELILYQLPKKQVIGCINSLKAQDLCNFLLKRKLKIDIVVLNMYKPYVDLFYALYPDSLVCIAPHVVKALFNQKLMGTIDKTSFVVEVAATLDLNAVEYTQRDDLNQFISDFYSASQANEALVLYEAWQADIPLNNPKVYRCVRAIEFYKREILNYFELKKALARFK